MLYKIKIPQTKEEKEITIIYKRGKDEFHELKTSKNEFYKTLRYFNQTTNENGQNDLVYIQENISFDIFEQFISSITKKEIEINQNNFPHFFYLCNKFQYHEFQTKLLEIIKEKPDFLSLIDDQQIKEDIIAQNLDISIQDNILNDLPLEQLNRILNSPKKVIKDHHLLFSFVIQNIQKYQRENLNEKDQQNLKILTRCLDFSKMTNEEVEELFEKEKINSFVNSNEQIQNFLKNENELKQKISKLEQRMNELERNLRTQIENLEEELQKNVIKINQHEKTTEKQTQEVDEEQFIEQIKEDDENTKFAINQLQQFFKIQSQMQKEDTEDEEDEESKDEIEDDNLFEIKQFEYKKDDELNGIIKYLSDEAGGNPHDKGIIEVTSNSICSPSCHPKNLLNSVKEDDYLPKSSELNAWVCFDFKNMLIEVSKYSIKSSDFGKDYGHLKNWLIESSNNGKDWKPIDEHSNYCELNGPNIIKSFDVKPNDFARYYRFRNTGEYWGIKEKWGIQFNSIEFYGRLKTQINTENKS